MRIAVDAMGGDHAPEVVVKGTLDAALKWPDLELILVGLPAKIRDCAGGTLPANVEIEEAAETIAMGEHPAAAVRQKKNASIVVATRLVKEQKAQALVSAGSTGAQMAAALFGLGRVRGIERPAIGTVLPTKTGGKILLDVGANPDAKPENLYQFAVMGSIYAEHILNIERPSVALLNIGSEEGKGNLTAQAAYTLLKESDLNFIGNVEGKDLPWGRADVVVCDAFVGNIVLKTIEGLSSYLFSQIKESLTASTSRKIGAALVKPALKEIAGKLDYSVYGGAPLLGVQGTSIVCHGRSNATAIMNAIGVARRCIEERIVERITEILREEKVNALSE